MFGSLLQIQDAATGGKTRGLSFQDAAAGTMNRGSARQRSIESQPQRSPSRAVASKPGAAVGRMSKGMSLQRSMESQVIGGGVTFWVEM